jgi:hypothetical protein
MIVLPMHQRMAELWTLQSRRRLTAEEKSELNLCLEANAKWVWQKIACENLSQLAQETKDQAWLQELEEQEEDQESRP